MKLPQREDELLKGRIDELTGYLASAIGYDPNAPENKLTKEDEQKGLRANKKQGDKSLLLSSLYTTAQCIASLRLHPEHAMQKFFYADNRSGRAIGSDKGETLRTISIPYLFLKDLFPQLSGLEHSPVYENNFHDDIRKRITLDYINQAINTRAYIPYDPKDGRKINPELVQKAREEASKKPKERHHDEYRKYLFGTRLSNEATFGTVNYTLYNYMLPEFIYFIIKKYNFDINQFDQSKNDLALRSEMVYKYLEEFEKSDFSARYIKMWSELTPDGDHNQGIRNGFIKLKNFVQEHPEIIPTVIYLMKDHNVDLRCSNDVIDAAVRQVEKADEAALYGSSGSDGYMGDFTKHLNSILNMPNIDVADIKPQIHLCNINHFHYAYLGDGDILPLHNASIANIVSLFAGYVKGDIPPATSIQEALESLRQSPRISSLEKKSLSMVGLDSHGNPPSDGLRH